MERLKVGVGDPYDPIEASLHVGRYALALPFAAGRRVLDVACGEGYGSWLLTESGAAEVVGVDISSDAILKARATFRADRLRFETSAGESLPQILPLAHFDLIVSLETIEHVADPEAFLLALRQVATPDAIFVFTCPNDHWYYRDGRGNPHHLRRLTFDQFKSLTTEFLGRNVRWFLGSPTLGFAAVSADQGWRDRSAESKYAQVFPSRLTLRVPSGEECPSASNVSYFIGLWNAPDPIDGAGAYQAVSMDYYSKMMWTATSMEQLADLNAEVTALRTQQDDLNRTIAALRFERDSLSGERDALGADLTRVQAECDAKATALATEIGEKEILGLQAAALRRENEIVSSQLPALRAALDAAQRQQTDLQALLNNEREVMAVEVAALGGERDALRDSLDWHIARVVSLDEALSWHVARIQILESEGPRRLVRRALSRTVRAWPPLARLVSRLRRHGVTQADNL